MTLREIQAILTRVPFDRAMVSQNGQVLTNLREFKSAVQQLAPIPEFAPPIREIQDSPLYSTASDSAGLGSNADEWKRAADLIILSAAGLKRVLDSMLPSIPPETILVKLPPDQALSNVAQLLQELQKVLGQLVALEGIEGDVQVTSWETGSLLVFLYLKSLAAVDLVGRALRAAAIVYQEIQKGRLIGQHVRLLKVKVESARDIQEA
jgi:hypothetical protein